MTKIQRSGAPARRSSVAGMVGTALLLASAGSLAGGGRVADGAGAARAPAVVAHRGGAMLRPENTMPAFRHAAGLGVEVLEFDMLMTADGRIAVYHDADINADFCAPEPGSGVVAGPVRGLSFDQTQRFDCGSRVRPAYAGEKHLTVPGARIPALDEVLDGFRDSGAIFFAETKFPRPTPGVADVDPVEFAARLEAAVRERGLEERLILQSFDYRTLDALHELNPRIRTCLLGAGKLNGEYLAAIRRHRASCIVLGLEDGDRDAVRRLQDAGVLVYSGVADTQEEWARYVGLGVDAIFTNDPEGAIAYLRRAGLRD
nr:glycerophosphodiester phosphodiesterase family protein [Luteimonas sp. Y-2-2-4F]